MQNHRHFNSVGVGAATLVTLLAGCSMDMTPMTGSPPPARRTGDFANRRINDVTLAEVEPIADRVFRSHFRVDPAASTATVWVARPAEAADVERTGGTIGERLAVSSREHRRVAELRLTQDGTGVIVQCKVTIQRLSTVERAAFARERGDDRPTDTPIDRAGPSAAQKRQEWTDLRRDRALEQQILNAIQECLTTTQPAQ